jgi:hypothetical protein
MSNRVKQKPVPLQKKSVSRAPAFKGREDSRAVQIKNEQNTRRIRSKRDPAKLAEVYAERQDDADRNRKVHRREKHKDDARRNDSGRSKR